MVWDKSAKHSPQRCGVNHPLKDEDVVQIVTRTNKQQQQDKNYQSIVQGFSDKVRLFFFVSHQIECSHHVCPLLLFHLSFTRRDRMPRRKRRVDSVDDFVTQAILLLGYLTFE